MGENRKSVKVNPEAIKNYVSKMSELKTSSDAKSSAIKISDTRLRGNVYSPIKDSMEYCKEIDSVLNEMIQNTIDLLNNALDGYVDADEKSANSFNVFSNSLSSEN